jgi:hypothetical protein
MIARVSAYTKYTSNADAMHPPASELGAEPLATNFELPAGAAISRVALVLPADLSIDAWAQLGAKIGTFDKAFRWHLGDWWHFGAHSYGARKAKVQAQGAFPFEFATLMNLGWVAGKVETSLRREALSWSHHVLIAPYEPAEQEKWLKKSVRFKWPVKRLRQELYEAALQRTAEQKIYDHALHWSWRLETAAKSWQAFAWGIESQLLSHLQSPNLNELANLCDEASKWWADTAAILHALADANAEWEDRMEAQWEADTEQAEAAE